MNRYVGLVGFDIRIFFSIMYTFRNISQRLRLTYNFGSLGAPGKCYAFSILRKREVDHYQNIATAPKSIRNMNPGAHVMISWTKLTKARTWFA